MVGGPHTKLSNLPNAQDATLSNILLDNFIAFMIGAFLIAALFTISKYPSLEYMAVIDIY